MIIVNIYTMKKITSRLLLVLATYFIFTFGCTSDELPEPSGLANCVDTTPTYETNVRPIIDNTCAYSGCHLDSAPGNYATYNGMKFVLENGLFRQRVFDLKEDAILGMPPNNAPTGKPKDLTEEELSILRCWVENGFPEK